MKICLIAEGCYPYVAGGVSSWVQMLIEGMPEHRFVIYTIGANEEGHIFFREFHTLKAFLDRVDGMSLVEDDVARLESATANFLAELRHVADKAADKRLLQ